jgi:glycosyltransferase involved in cell wall biosynthesis
VLTPRNPAALGDAIASLLADDARRERLAAAGRPRAEANFDYRSLVAQLVTWLERVPN